MTDNSVQVIKPETEKAIYSAENLIQQAIDKGVPIETMERLLAMRRELKAEFAKQAFDAAMSKFQSECPVIEKTKVVLEKDGRTVRYRYAPLDSIVNQVKKPLADNGLSYTFDEEKDEKFTSIICIVTHISGHTQKTAFKIPIGSEAYMSDVQKYGARMTFGKRYAFCNAFGIMTGDEDTDAVDTAENKKQLPAVNKQVNQMPTTAARPNPIPPTHPAQINNDPPTEKQINLIYRLCEQKQKTVNVESIKTKYQAKQVIEKLIALPTIKQEGNGYGN